MRIGQRYNNKFYQDSIKKYGVSAKGVHWNSKYNQYIRFDVITSFIKKKIKNLNIVDAGCGFGEYYNYLKFKQNLPNEYTGLDCENDMIRICKNRFQELNFFKINILEERLPIDDVYIASGSLNLLLEDEFYQFIDKCYDASIKGFIFNFLYINSFNNILATEVLDYCKSKAQELEFKKDYLKGDITIYMKK